jgi:hypothetical protein
MRMTSEAPKYLTIVMSGEGGSDGFTIPFPPDFLAIQFKDPRQLVLEDIDFGIA